jgi:isocitrate dehydrogenase
MTKDLILLSTLAEKRGVNTDEFLDAIAARLEDLM